MLVMLIRTLILYVLVIFIMRIMGKKQIAQLEPYELVITIMISELVSMPMQDPRIPLVHGIIPAITLMFIEAILSFLQLKNENIRLILSGKPTIIISKGKLDRKALKNSRFNLNDLMEDLRVLGYFNLDDIEYAILETSGEISVIPKAKNAGVTREDLKLKASEEKLPVTLILDGVVHEKNLKLLNKDKDWLINKLKEHKIDNYENVFIAIIDSKGKFYFQLKE